MSDQALPMSVVRFIKMHTTDTLRHKLLADLFDLPVWERGKDRVVNPPWATLLVAERDLIADALRRYDEKKGNDNVL